MNPSACQSRLELCIGAIPFPVLGLSGRETLNRPFTFELSVLADGWSQVAQCLGDPASITMIAPDGFRRQVNGIVTEIEGETNFSDGQSIIKLTVESSLVLLQQRSDSRLIVSETLPNILRQTLGRNGIADCRLLFALARNYPVRPTTLQAEENDLEFLLRLTGRQGLLFWSEADEGDEILHIADTTNHCSMLTREILTYLPNAGLETDTGGVAKVGMLSIEDRAEMVPARFWVHDVHENAPEHPTLAGRPTAQAQDTGPQTQSVTFGSGAANEEEARHQALIRAQHADCIHHTLRIRTHAADLRVGSLIRLDTTGFSTTLSGDYLITAVEHTARQYAGYGLDGEADCPYTNTAVLIQRKTPWRPEIRPTDELPLIFSARIESRDSIPELDGAGRYRYRQYPNSNQAPHAEASAPTRRLQPYASPSDGMPFGWHLPLHDDNEVLISCLNNDPDQPMLVGTLSNPAHGSVVTAENAHQNLLYTFSGNKLAMDDWRDKSAITFCTFAGHTMLHFNADVAGHRINLETGLGRMEYYAKKTIATESGDTLTETVGGDRLQQIENRQQSTTKQKEIHYQAATDGEITAADNIQLKSGKNIELTAGQDLHLDITESTRIHVHEQDAIIQIDSGSLTITADGAIDIQGDGRGTMYFCQNGGGITIAPNGDITLFGNNIDIKGRAVNFSGNINKEIGEAPPAPVATELAPLSVVPINKLADPDPPPGNFRLRVLNHLCWDTYDEKAQLFHPGEMDNKPMPEKKFRIRLPDDSIVESITDSAGEIELTGKAELDGEFHTLFEPEEAKLHDSYALFDELKHPLGKEPNIHQAVEQNGPNGPIVFRKTGLKCGDMNIISIHRPSVILDSHIHIQSGNCATLSFLWDASPFPLNKLNKSIGVSRGSVEAPGLGFSYVLDFLFEWLGAPIAHPVRAAKQATGDKPKNPQEGMVHTSPVRQLLTQQKATTLEIGDAFMVERDNVLANYFLTQPEYKELSHLVLSAVVMTMDMEYAHLDGYYGLRIYNAIYEDEDFSKNPSGYWYPRHGIWTNRGSHYEKAPGPAGLFPDHYTKGEYDSLKITTKEQKGIIGAYPKPGGQFEAMRVQAAPVEAPKSETERYEQWKEQLDYTEQAMLAYPLKMLPMYHFDPRRWQFQPEEKGQNGLDDLFDNVKAGGLYLGFKMYTAQGYRPWDINRLPILADFYAECSRLRIPILNHCTPKGAATVEQELYCDFIHPNDTYEESQEKEDIAQKYTALRGNSPLQSTGSHFPGTTSSTQDYKSQENQEYFSENFVSPNAWRKVLGGTVEGRPLRDLHLCLAHFGGPTRQGREWSKQIIEMMKTYPNVYTDISSSFASGKFRKHFKEIMEDKETFEIVRNRVLFGTDWYMTLLYTAPFHGMNYWEYCTTTKTFLDDIHSSLWPRFTMHNPYRFYRLSEQAPRIAESIITRRKAPENEEDKEGTVKDDKIMKIRKEAAWIRQANDGFGI